MKTASAKNKGRLLQKHAAKVLQEEFDLPETDVVSRSMGSSGTDLMLSDRALKEFPISLECKNTKLFPSLSALKQSHENALEDTLPGVCWKPPGKSMEESIIYFNYREFVSWTLNNRGEKI